MTRDEFNLGLSRITRSFPAGLSDQLWDYYKTDETSIWMKACRRLARRKRGEPSFRDFLEAVMHVRRETLEGRSIEDVAGGIVKKIDEIVGPKEDS